MAREHSAGAGGSFRLPRLGTPAGKHRGEGRAERRREPRYEGVHRTSPPNPRGGAHRADGRTPPTAQPSPDGVWYPTKGQWERLAQGETVNGVRLDVRPPGYRGTRRARG